MAKTKTWTCLCTSDIRDIFDRRPTVDRLTSAVIVADLHEMPHGLWSEWRGPRDDQTPRRAVAGGAGAHAPRHSASAPRRSGRRDAAHATGQRRATISKQFEAAWAAYCEGTPAQHGDVTYLASAMGKYERDDKDLYPTPPWVVDALAEHLDIRGKIIWERTVGTGQMTEALKVTGVAPGTYNRSPYEREVKAALTLWSRACISARRGARKQGRAAARLK